MLKSAIRGNSPDRMLESFYERHVKDIYRYALALLDRRADAEDATQTTFLNAYRALERGERPRDAGKWLRAIALNVCREHHRRAGRRPDEISLDHDPGELVQDPPTEIGDVLRGLSCLPFNQRTALVMREFEGRSMAEIAAALDVSCSAVETLLFRARRGLREQLDATLTCSEAELAISRQLDGALPRSERGQLRAHLRSCEDCAALARRVRAQRSALRSLRVLIPVPVSLKLFKLVEGGGMRAEVAAGAGAASGPPLLATLAGSAASKIAAATVVGAAAVGLGYSSLHRHATHRIARPGRTVPAIASSKPRGVLVAATRALPTGTPTQPRTRPKLIVPNRVAVRDRHAARRVVVRDRLRHPEPKLPGSHSRAHAHDQVQLRDRPHPHGPPPGLAAHRHEPHPANHGNGAGTHDGGTKGSGSHGNGNQGSGNQGSGSQGSGNQSNGKHGDGNSGHAH